VAWLYDPLVEKLSFGRERKFREKTLQFMKFGNGGNILDIGCGTGSLALLIAEKMKGKGQVIGIDAAPRMIAIAGKKAGRQGLPVIFRTGIAEQLDFDDNFFDQVVNSMFTHHIDTELKKKAFAEMFRVLKPGGFLVTADIDRPTSVFARLLGWLSRYLLLQPELEDNLRGFLPAFIEEAGFTGLSRHDQVYGLVSFFTSSKPRG
jgi:ubiquinone/menaquinone biosynthesis C-methylase UbiE